MIEQDRWNLIHRLDDELLLGGAMLSEWCCFIIKEADTAFAKGANLASILTSVSGIETYLRFEYGDTEKQSLFELIESSDLDADLKNDLHRLRKYRNKWVHVGDPWDDADLQDNPERYEQELDDTAFFAARVLRRTVYSSQCV